MRLTFRQGIARYQTDLGANPIFLQKNGTFIDLVVSPDPTIITFAHRGANYVYEEASTVKNAWGSFSDATTQYLFWEVNLLTGQLTRQHTRFAPVAAGTAPPTNFILDASKPGGYDGQSWFDLSTTTMRVWNGSIWQERLRVFAATYSSSAVIQPYRIGTQVGITGEYEGGSPILDSYLIPLRQSDGTFLTSTTNTAVVALATKRIRFETEVLMLTASENIPRFSAVVVLQGRHCRLARATDWKTRAVGITAEEMFTGDSSIVVSGGLMHNEQWNWATDKINRPLFCGPTGALTLTPPQVTGVLQQVGYVYDTDTIFVDIRSPVVLSNPYDAEVPIEPPPGPNQAPVANFSVVPFITTAPAPFVATFQDLSTNSPTSWQWDFTGDGVTDSTAQHPIYTYGAPGVYTVRLRAGNSFGTDDEVKTNYINVSAAPPSAGKTNLDITLSAPASARSNQLFTLTVNARNDGFLTATSVQRTVQVYDIGTTQIEITGLPPGAIKTRSTSGTPRTIVTLPLIASIITSAQVTTAFTLKAPIVSGKKDLLIDAKIASPEVDSTPGDNTTSTKVSISQ